MATEFRPPNFKKHAADLEQGLPLVASVGNAVLQRLPQLPKGSLVLDVACGTGEPGLTLARMNSGVEVKGVDTSEPSIEIATSKATQDGLNNISFQAMPSEELQFESNTFNAIISRFGLGMFGDVNLGTSESFRVLKSGGHLSIAVWHRLPLNTAVTAIFQSFSRHAQHPALSKVPGSNCTALLQQTGFDNVRAEEFCWNYEFDSDAALDRFTNLMSTMMFGEKISTLSKQEVESFLADVRASLSNYKNSDGAYSIPHTCEIISAIKP